MKVVLDTKVLVSGVFFSGPARQILEAWRDGRGQLVASLEILEEYRRVGERLGAEFEGVSLEPFFTLLQSHHQRRQTGVRGIGLRRGGSNQASELHRALPLTCLRSRA